MLVPEKPRLLGISWSNRIGKLRPLLSRDGTELVEYEVELYSPGNDVVLLLAPGDVQALIDLLSCALPKEEPAR